MVENDEISSRKFPLNCLFCLFYILKPQDASSLFYILKPQDASSLFYTLFFDRIVC